MARAPGRCRYASSTMRVDAALTPVIVQRPSVIDRLALLLADE
jgi:hypothetical protein